MINGNTLPTLESSRVVLRPLEDADVSALFEVFSDPEVMRHWSSAPWTEQAQGMALIENVRRCFVDGTLYQWGIARRSDDTVIGTCTLSQIDAQNRRAEIGFILRHDRWGQGIMSEATHALLRFAFEELNLHRIEADVDPRNDASIRLLERQSFQREGYLRERWLVGDEINDTVFYGLLRHEWLVVNAHAT